MKRRQGLEVQTVLRGAGLPAFVRQSDTDGSFTATFSAPSCEAATDSAATWAQRLGNALDGITIVDATDTHAPWRGENYVLIAAVRFTGQPTQKETPLMTTPADSQPVTQQTLNEQLGAGNHHNEGMLENFFTAEASRQTQEIPTSETDAERDAAILDAFIAAPRIVAASPLPAWAVSIPGAKLVAGRDLAPGCFIYLGEHSYGRRLLKRPVEGQNSWLAELVWDTQYGNVRRIMSLYIDPTRAYVAIPAATEWMMSKGQERRVAEYHVSIGGSHAK